MKSVHRYVVEVLLASKRNEREAGKMLASDLGTGNIPLSAVFMEPKPNLWGVRYERASPGDISPQNRALSEQGYASSSLDPFQSYIYNDLIERFSFLLYRTHFGQTAAVDTAETCRSSLLAEGIHIIPWLSPSLCKIVKSLAEYDETKYPTNATVQYSSWRSSVAHGSCPRSANTDILFVVC